MLFGGGGGGVWPDRPLGSVCNRLQMAAGGFWDENGVGWPTPPRLPPSRSQKQVKNGLFRLFYTVFSTNCLSTSDHLPATISPDMWVQMKIHVDKHPVDVLTPSCAPHSGPLAISIFSRFWPIMGVFMFDMNDHFSHMFGVKLWVPAADSGSVMSIDVTKWNTSVQNR